MERDAYCHSQHQGHSHRSINKLSLSHSHSQKIIMAFSSSHSQDPKIQHIMYKGAQGQPHYMILYC